MKFKINCELSYNVTQLGTLIFNICPVAHKYQRISEESLCLHPSLAIEKYTETFANNRYFRVNSNGGQLTVNYQAIVDVFFSQDNPSYIEEIPPLELPLSILTYLYPSRYCQSDLLMRMAEQEFGYLSSGYSRVTAICNWIYDKVYYITGSSNNQTSAYDTATERAGVCRDFAHLGIAFCRALNIPARFVSVYAYNLNPPDFHAVFEAYLSGRWYLFDPTRLVSRQGLIRIGTGRDAADVSFATLFGQIQMEKQHISVECLEIEKPQFTTEAISYPTF